MERTQVRLWESVCARGKLSRRGVSRASRPRFPPPRMVTRVGDTARLRSAAPAKHKRFVSKNPAEKDEGARRRRKRKGLLDSRRRAGTPLHALSVGSLAPHESWSTRRTLHLHPRITITPTAPPSGPRQVVPRSAAPCGPNLPAPRRPSGCRVLAPLPPPGPSAPASAPPQPLCQAGPSALHSGRSPTCSPRPVEHRDIKY